MEHAKYFLHIDLHIQSFSDSDNASAERLRYAVPMLLQSIMYQVPMDKLIPYFDV